MIESDFSSEIAAEAIGFSERQFDLVVEPLDNAVGKLLSGFEIVEQKSAVTLKGGGHFLKLGQAAAGHSRAPGIEELSGPGRRPVGPEVLDAKGERMLTVAEVSERTGFTPGAVRDWIKRSVLAAVRVGKEYRIRETELTKLLEGESRETMSIARRIGRRRKSLSA